MMVQRRRATVSSRLAVEGRGRGSCPRSGEYLGERARSACSQPVLHDPTNHYARSLVPRDTWRGHSRGRAVHSASTECRIRRGASGNPTSRRSTTSRDLEPRRAVREWLPRPTTPPGACRWVGRRRPEVSASLRATGPGDNRGWPRSRRSRTWLGHRATPHAHQLSNSSVRCAYFANAQAVPLLAG